MKLIKYWLKKLTVCRGYCKQKLYPSPCLGCPVGQGIEIDKCEKKVDSIYNKHYKRLRFKW